MKQTKAPKTYWYVLVNRTGKWQIADAFEAALACFMGQVVRLATAVEVGAEENEFNTAFLA